MCISERLKILRKEHLNGMSQDKFAERIGTSGAAISRYESGDRSIPNPIIVSICSKFHVNEEWMCTGKGDVFVKELEPTDADVLRKLVEEAGGNEIILAIMQCWARLESPQRDALNRFIDDIVKEYQETKNSAHSSK